MVDDLLNMDEIFRALASQVRRGMLERLAERDRSVSELAEPFEMTLAGASKHVKVLEGAGLVRQIVVGRNHICHLQVDPLAAATDWLHFYEPFWSERLDALAAMFIEDPIKNEDDQ